MSHPSASATLPSLYPLLHAVLFPQFTQPLLDNAATYHDPLLEDTTLFTAATRTREIGIEVDGVLRYLRRGCDGRSAGDVKDVLEAVRRRRQEVAGRSTKEEVIVRARERRRAFDTLMKREEEEALREFKEGLRKAVENR